MSSNRLHRTRAPRAEEQTAPAGVSRNRWASAVRHLRRVDPHLRAIIDRIGPCRLQPYPDRFGALVRSIVGQQISSKAAASIHRRLVELGGEPHRPARLIELGEVQLRTAGLSAAKARYVLNLAEAVASGQTPVDAFDDSWNDEAITQALVAVKGVGVWTAHMFLIFALNRPDVFPASDLGVRAALRDRHGLAELPSPRDCHALADLWRPYRSIASWYIWKGADTKRDGQGTQPAPTAKPSRQPKPHQ
jgi:DNA-3-methyladenine glycosylase II